MALCANGIGPYLYGMAMPMRALDGRVPSRQCVPWPMRALDAMAMRHVPSIGPMTCRPCKAYAARALVTGRSAAQVGPCATFPMRVGGYAPCGLYTLLGGSSALLTMGMG